MPQRFPKHAGGFTCMSPAGVNIERLMRQPPKVEFVALPVKDTWPVVYPAGTMKKSDVLTACPARVVTLKRPDMALSGIVVDRDVVVAESTGVSDWFSPMRLFNATASKCVPVMVTAVDAGPIAGVKLVIVGRPASDRTVNADAEFAEPPGDVTLNAPVVAPAGTVTTNCVAVAELTAAVVPLN